MGDGRGGPWEHNPGPTTQRLGGTVRGDAELPGLGREAFRWHHGPMFFEAAWMAQPRWGWSARKAPRTSRCRTAPSPVAPGARMQHLLRHLGPIQAFLSSGVGRFRRHGSRLDRGRSSGRALSGSPWHPLFCRMRFDHPDDHPDDPSRSVRSHLDRRGIQREQARFVWSRPGRRRASVSQWEGRGFESLLGLPTLQVSGLE
jgi:hypothetical protein